MTIGRPAGQAAAAVDPRRSVIDISWSDRWYGTKLHICVRQHKPPPMRLLGSRDVRALVETSLVISWVTFAIAGRHVGRAARRIESMAARWRSDDRPRPSK
jgi:hypothetical protein